MQNWETKDAHWLVPYCMCAPFFPTATPLFHSMWTFAHFSLSFSTIHLAVSAAVVPSTAKKRRTLGPEPALLFFLSSAHNLDLLAFSPFWKYFSTAPSKPWGPLETHARSVLCCSFTFYLTGEKVFFIFWRKNTAKSTKVKASEWEFTTFLKLKYTPDGLSGRQRP